MCLWLYPLLWCVFVLIQVFCESYTWQNLGNIIGKFHKIMCDCVFESRCVSTIYQYKHVSCSKNNPLFPQRPSLLSLRPVSAWTFRLTFRSCQRSPSLGERVSLDWLHIKLTPLAPDLLKRSELSFSVTFLYITFPWRIWRLICIQWTKHAINFIPWWLQVEAVSRSSRAKIVLFDANVF